MSTNPRPPCGASAPRLLASMVLLGISAAGLTGCVARPATVAGPTAGTLTVPADVRVKVAGTVREVPLDEYVLGAVLAEVSPSGESPGAAARILEVQALVARTYAVRQLGRHRAEGFDLCDTTHCQVYDAARIKTARASAAAADAVRRTSGQVLSYGTHVVEALFHADCGGMTAPADAVWGGKPVPYLRAVDDDVPAAAHREWKVSATREQLLAALNADPRTQAGGRLDEIEVVARDASGRAAGLGVRGERSFTVRGDILRTVLNRGMGAPGLLSTRFSVTRSRDTFVFTGSGYGHGVGLCQRGAAARARRGDSVEQILSAYFPGARLATARTAQ